MKTIYRGKNWHGRFEVKDGTAVWVEDKGYRRDAAPDWTPVSIAATAAAHGWSVEEVEGEVLNNTPFEELRSLAQAVVDTFDYDCHDCHASSEPNLLALRAFLDKLVKQ